MAIDMFLNIQDNKIKGECTDKAHPDTIRVLTWNWKASRSIDMRFNSDSRMRGRMAFSELTLTKFVDRSSPMLLDALATATLFKEVKLLLRKSGGSPLDYLTYTMEQVMISSIEGGVIGSEDRQIEKMTLIFLRVTMSYQAQGADGGKAGGLVEATAQATPPG